LSFYFTKKEHQDTNINTATFQNIGLSAPTETALLQEHLQEQAGWKKLTEKEPSHSSKTLMAVALGYILSGELLLIIYALTAISFQLKVLWCSAVLLMILAAYAKAKITGGSFFKTIITQLVYGVLLAVSGVFIISKMK
jgi:VIT1/CCC1 family predicted Fe2+/Mn2+ transporter